MSKTKTIEKILSIKNDDVRKVVTICGIRFKIKSNKLLQRKQLRLLEQKLNDNALHIYKVQKSINEGLDTSFEHYNRLTALSKELNTDINKKLQELKINSDTIRLELQNHSDKNFDTIRLELQNHFDRDRQFEVLQNYFFGQHNR